MASRFLYIAVMLLFLTVQFRYFFAGLGYYVNLNTYKTVLCENKDQKEWLCEGSCVLKDKLENLSDQKTDSPTDQISGPSLSYTDFEKINELQITKPEGLIIYTRLLFDFNTDPKVTDLLKPPKKLS